VRRLAALAVNAEPPAPREWRRDALTHSLEMSRMSEMPVLGAMENCICRLVHLLVQLLFDLSLGKMPGSGDRPHEHYTILEYTPSSKSADWQSSKLPGPGDSKSRSWEKNRAPRSGFLPGAAGC
jgi:hypothetical protein